MVTTRNRSKRLRSAAVPAIELPLPTRTRRSSRQSKTKEPVIEEHEDDSETLESSSPTITSDLSTPPREAEEDEKSISVHNNNNNIRTENEESEEDQKVPEQEIAKDQASSDDSSDDDSDGSSDESQADSEDEDEQGYDDNQEEESDDDEDLDQLLVKAQASLKRKAMFEEKNEEVRFNFPKLKTGLDTNNVYIKQDGARAKVDMNTVVVVEKGVSGSNAVAKSDVKTALETCEVNMNAEKVHVSKKQKKEEREKTAGKGWFDLPQQVLTPELKRDLQILKLRNVLDPKRFYKRAEKGKAKFPKYFQMGTIIEGNTEFYSSRLTKKERATTITGEVMKDLTGRDYYKRKFNEIQEVKQSGGKRFNKKGKGKQSNSWRANKK
ncbi:hypothetical protein BGZ51_006435 [Haplosporangium sp. Z 767]|nr:hypothetical protein BGZ51_006435 [Haplosporangium sp. Z 767]